VKKVALRVALGRGSRRIITQLLQKVLCWLICRHARACYRYGALQLLRFWNPGNLPGWRYSDGWAVLGFNFVIS